MPRGGTRLGAGRPRGPSKLKLARLALEAAAASGNEEAARRAAAHLAALEQMRLKKTRRSSAAVGAQPTPAPTPVPPAIQALTQSAVASAQTTFDALEQKITMAKVLITLAAEERKKLAAANPKLVKEFAEAASRALDGIIPYQVAPVPRDMNLTFPQLDLSKATDAQLAALDALIAAITNARGDSDGAG